MKIHLKQIPAQGLHLDGDEDCPIHDLEVEGIHCAGQLHYNIDVGCVAYRAWKNSRTKFECPHLPCTRSCLDRRRSTSRRSYARISCLTFQRIRAATEMAIAFAR
jgi:hypothetical protein